MTKNLQLPTIIRDDNYCQSKLVIHHPRFKELHEVIVECIEETEQYGEPQCLYLSGQTGVGKSTLVQDYADQFPRYHTDERGWTIPALYLETPHPITVKGMSSSMLNAMRDPEPFKGTQANLSERIHDLLVGCQTSLVILDDFHHLIDRGTDTVFHAVSDWLKVLIKRTGIVFVIVGVDERIDYILESSDQLRRLFVDEKLLPFSYDFNNRTSVEEFAMIITYVQKSLEIRLSSEIPSGELLLRIHYATEGKMKNIMALFQKAKRECKKGNTNTNPQISLELLSEAYESRVKKNVRRANPFLTPANEQFVPPAPTVGELEPTLNGGVSKRKSRRNPKRKQPSAQQVLTKK